MIAAIGFDGDDTLWHNEVIFTLTQARFQRLLEPYLPGTELEARLIATEGRNLHLFGYGIKGFMLSMIETAIEVSGGRVGGAEVEQIIAYGKAMLEQPTELLDGARAAIEAFQGRYQLILITKGDLFDQESKIVRSGLTELFSAIEIVSEKDERTYRRILSRRGISPSEFLMVGNSIKSDILPVAAIGARAVHVPYHTTWAHERAELAEDVPGVWSLASLAELPELVMRIDNGRYP